MQRMIVERVFLRMFLKEILLIFIFVLLVFGINKYLIELLKIKNYCHKRMRMAYLLVVLMHILLQAMGFSCMVRRRISLTKFLVLEGFLRCLMLIMIGL